MTSSVTISTSQSTINLLLRCPTWRISRQVAPKTLQEDASSSTKYRWQIYTRASINTPPTQSKNGASRISFNQPPTWSLKEGTVVSNVRPQRCSTRCLMTLGAQLIKKMASRASRYRTLLTRTAWRIGLYSKSSSIATSLNPSRLALYVAHQRPTRPSWWSLLARQLSSAVACTCYQSQTRTLVQR